MLDHAEHYHPYWSAVVAILGVSYFSLWSFSFYPQIFLNYRRKTTTGLSPDFAILNPLGFFALTLWNAFTLFSPLTRREYASRHEGHSPSVSIADFAFSLHALLASLFMLSQSFYYARKNRHTTTSISEGDDEGQPLLANKTDLTLVDNPVRPSLFAQLSLLGIFLGALISAILVWTGKSQLLDWLYYASSVKLYISLVKYIPQVFLVWKIRSLRGFAIGNVLADLGGSVLSFAQLVISSIFIEHDAGGIIANPAKLGLSGISLGFDIIFILQRYYWFAEESKADAEEEVDR